MSKHLRRYLAVVLCGTVILSLLCVKAGMGFLGERRNHTLVAAIKRSDNNGALRALAHGADPNAADIGQPAASFGSYLFARLHAATTHTVPKRSRSALALAVERNDTAIVLALIKRGARDTGETLITEDRSHYDQLPCSLLTYTVGRGNAQIARALVTCGGNVGTTDAYRQTPLFYSLDRDTCDALLDCGADIRAVDADGNSALDRAVSDDAREACKVLITRGAKDSRAMLLATLCGNTDVLNLMLSAGWSADTGDHASWSPLMVALNTRIAPQPDAALLLIRHGADVTIRDEDGLSPLHLAADGGNGMVESGADYAAPTIVNALIARGANVNATDRRGVTPLMVAALHNRPILARLLLQHGANAAIKMNNGYSALSLAQMFKSARVSDVSDHRELIRLLHAALDRSRERHDHR